jgi:hypothetical protein
MKVPTIIHTFGRIKGEVDWESVGVSGCRRIGVAANAAGSLFAFVIAS